jgi:ABC-type multidrug transport system permease subunit
MNRLAAVIRKEFKHIRRDRGLLLVLLLEPLVIMSVFGYAFQGNITNLPTIIVNEDNSPYSDQIINAVERSEYFRVVQWNDDLEKAKAELRASRIRAIIHIPAGFGSMLNNATKAEIRAYIDSSDYVIYNTLRAAASGIIKESGIGIMQIIVADLEKEREENEARVNEVQALVDDLSFQIVDAKEKIENITKKFTENKVLLTDASTKVEAKKTIVEEIEAETLRIRDDFGGLLTALEMLGQKYPEAADDINLIHGNATEVQGTLNETINDLGKIQITKSLLNLDRLENIVSENEGLVNEINATISAIERDYLDIQERMDSLHLELRTLKKEFLSNPTDIQKEFVFGQVSYFEYLTPAVLSMIIFFVCVFIATINLVEGKVRKTIFRVATTPLKKHELLGGKFVVFSFVGIVESLYALLLAVFLFDVRIAGSLLNVFIILFLLILASSGIGLLLSSIVRTLRQCIMLLPLVVLPAILISQTFAPVEVMPEFMQHVAKLSPMLYSNIALRAIMIKGAALVDVAPQITALAIYAVVTLSIGIAISKKRIK